MEQPDELVLDFDDDLLDTSTSSAPVGDTDESTAAYSIAPTACEGADVCASSNKDTPWSNYLGRSVVLQFLRARKSKVRQNGLQCIAVQAVG
uniref:Uncharacterized protein n=1 Tax=Plectus sambesii TaxID=2011161 RepID=A0A914VMX8_9BILA